MPYPQGPLHRHVYVQLLPWAQWMDQAKKQLHIPLKIFRVECRTASDKSTTSGQGPQLSSSLLKGGSRLASEVKAPDWLTPVQTRTPSLQTGVFLSSGTKYLKLSV